PATYRHTQHYGTLKLSPFFVLLLPPPPTSTLFPYTTLFRSSLPQSDLPRIQAQIAKSKGLNITMNVHDAGGAADITVPVNFVGKDRKSTRLNSSHVKISYAVFCLKKKKQKRTQKNNMNKLHL